MFPEQELWASARYLLKIHGPRAPAFAASRIAALTEAGDDDGVMAWRMIADRIDLLQGAEDGKVRD
ncbi:DUF6961 family protein [Sphingomonas solaris]|nr:hypothetical protein [Sphingomonas solaris]